MDCPQAVGELQAGTAAYAAPVSLWTDFGFRDNPYETSPVPPTAEGAELLVGRDREVARLLRQLRSSDTHPTIEGDNGVGKTSLVSVAGYLAMREFEEGATPQLYIPIAEPFQLSPTSSSDAFERSVLLRVADAIIKNEALLRRANLNVPPLERVDAWLNAPTFRSTQGGAFGFSAGGGSQANEASGFSEQGFREQVVGWLREIFPTPTTGGFVCTIDNLELLETSQAARALLEAVRDSVLGLPGLRWVLCGARGIVRAAASSPRLQGVVGDPMELPSLPDELVSEVIARRIEVYSILDSAYAPVDAAGFDHIYRVMHYNLRNAMKVCQDFALWMVDEGQHPTSSEDKLGLLEAYLALMSERYTSDTSLSPRAWEVFDRLVDLGGSTSPSDFAEFGFESNQAMRPHVKNLEEANLVSSSIDDTDRRRKTIVVAPRGWFVQYHRAGYQTLPRRS